MDKWKFLIPVPLTKKNLLALHELAGDLSIAEYLARVIRDHITAKSYREYTEVIREQYMSSVCDCPNKERNPIDAITCGWCGRRMS